MANTSNFNFELIPFDTIPWHQKEHDNWHIADSVFARFVSVNNMKGVWNNATAVALGEKYVDSDADTIWEVLLAHTTASTGTFSADRTANPSYWQGITVDQSSAGTWAAGTAYSVNDFVTDSNRYGVVFTAHTSVTSYNQGVSDGNIVTLIDLSTDLAAAETSATNAAASATQAATSVSSVNLPSIEASKFLQANAGATAYEAKTAAEVLTAITASGDITSAANLIATGTVEPAGDTSAGDNAAIGYTAAEGLILTGQGSTNDITIKNDADGEVCGVPTGTDDLRFPDNAKAEWGAAGDLQAYHDGSNSYLVDNGTGNLKIQGSQVDIIGSGETMATFADDGAAPLYHNNGVKIATTATGIQVTGTALVTTDTDTSNTGSVTLDFQTNQNFVLTFTGNVDLANPSTEQVGQAGVIVCIQDGTGSRTLSLGSQYKTAGDAGITLSTAANSVDIIPYFVSAADSIIIGAVQLAMAGA